ncbi:hypothetical protein SEA_JANEEMI_55 [Arthrobacter phage Janeemi]|uniref:Uncharacterized protein n=1 Tax=Arthrobacter phage Janeemi TaxID=2927240 RepID=A0A9E7QK76_9CAUD|nr:hypothetical protein SEA_JANEEMI_55 [Arthrobacter phage Janeemi]
MSFQYIDRDGDRLLIAPDSDAPAVLVGTASRDEVAVVSIDAEKAPEAALAILDGIGLVPAFPGAGQIAEGKLYAAAALLQEAVLEAAEANITPEPR